MNRNGLVASIVFASISLAPVGTHLVADEQPLAGYSVESSRAERQWEEKMRAIPDPDKVREYMKRLSARPHHVGSPYDKDNAEWLLAKFKEFGLDVSRYEYSVLVPWPGQRHVDIVAPDELKLQVEEEVIDGDRWATMPGMSAAMTLAMTTVTELLAVRM